MKITPEHYTALKTAMHAVMAARPNAQAEYKARGLSDVRFGFDVLYTAKIDGMSGTQFICDVLYKYLLDPHIKTAVLKIIKEAPTAPQEAPKPAFKRAPAATPAERLEIALQALLRRIEVGEEFPDACWAVAARQNVSYEALQAAYDTHCAQPQGAK